LAAASSPALDVTWTTVDLSTDGTNSQFCFAIPEVLSAIPDLRLEKIGVTSRELLMEKELWPMTQE
jgi:hypothetical protein